jgi:type VI secretion system secreted protein Hcp
MPFDTYVNIDGIKGEALDDKHKDWIQVLGFEHEMLMPVSATKSSAGGASTGRTHHGDFCVSHYLDAASPKLYEALSSGKHISKVVIEVMRAGGTNPVKLMSITLQQVMISKIHLSSDDWREGNGNGAHQDIANINPADLLPIEKIHLNYGIIEWVYTTQKRLDGTGGGNVNAKHDLTTNKGQ